MFLNFFSKKKQNIKAAKKIAAKKIGEGTSGCVHRPRLLCEDEEGQVNNDEISKAFSIKLKKHRDAEYEEFERIKNILGNDYKKYMVDYKKKCTSKDYTETFAKDCTTIEHNTSKAPLIIMQYGGNNLYNFVENYEKSKFSKTKEHEITEFWKSAENLFRGINFFHSKKFGHLDIKPDNIVYNMDKTDDEDDEENKHKMLFIDFGKSYSFEDLKKNFENGGKIEKDGKVEVNRFPTESGSINQFNYPFEVICYIKEIFLDFKKYYKETKTYNEFTNNFYPTTQRIEVVLQVIFGKNNYSDIFNIKNFKNEMYDFFWKLFKKNEENEEENEEKKIIEYNTFIEESISKLDTFGLGISLFHVLSRTKKFVKENNKINLKNLFYNMIRPDLYKRYDSKKSLEIYLEILKHWNEDNPEILNLDNRSFSKFNNKINSYPKNPKRNLIRNASKVTSSSFSDSLKLSIPPKHYFKKYFTRNKTVKNKTVKNKTVKNKTVKNKKDSFLKIFPQI